MRTVTIEKDGNNYTVNPNATSGGGITSIDDTITTFGPQDGFEVLLAVDSERNIITDINELPNASMILNVSSGGGSARACYRIDDSTIWNEDAEYSLGYVDDCTFTLSNGTLTITWNSYSEVFENIIVQQTPLGYISVGNVGS